MNTSYRPKMMTSTDKCRSIFVWGYNMQVVRKGKGEIAMTEGETCEVLRCDVEKAQL